MARTCIVLSTASSEREARKISSSILKHKLAACVNILPKISSSYWWQGKIETAHESLMIIKTKRSLTKKLTQHIKKIHSYSVPEVIALPILDGNTDYLKWIEESVS